MIRCLSRELGLSVDHFTDFECEKAERSILRGIGPVSQTQLTATAGRAVQWAPRSRATPGDRNSSGFFCEDVFVDGMRLRVTLFLPCSKQDIQGKSAQRIHGCSCVASSDPASPFHAVVRQQDCVVASAPMPLFLHSRVLFCTEAATVATIEASAVRLQIPTVGPLATDTLADTAAASLAPNPGAAGVPEHVIAAMGRW